LARFAPTETELDATLRPDDAAYQLVTVAGWCNDDTGHPWRRKRLRLVAEGAYLGWPGRAPGAVVDVTPKGVGTFNDGRRVYRYGLAYPIGIS
jgi:CRISPR/Cas system CSM-associated protein Csm4 (group 5 of RAMP superfamily)